MEKKILLVEDNENDLTILKFHLERAGYKNITVADNAIEGVKKTVDQKPDIVITDTLLPYGNGFEVCEKIRSLLGKEHPKVIIITGTMEAIDAGRARKSGADDYCAKSTDCSAIITALKNLP